MFVFLLACQFAIADSAVDAVEDRSPSADGALTLYVVEEHAAEWEEDFEGDAPARRLPPSGGPSPSPNPPSPTPPPTAATAAADQTPTPTPAPTSEASWAYFVMGTIALQA